MGLVSLLLFFPMYLFVEWFYPNYVSVLDYLAFLFLIVYFQCKISLLNNTFYKVMRLETKMLIANLSCVVLFIVLAFVFFPLFPQMKTIAICTMAAMLIRCYSSEISLSKQLNMQPSARIFLELFMVMVFLVATEFFSVWLSGIIYGIILVLWLLLDRKENSVVIEMLIHNNKNK